MMQTFVEAFESQTVWERLTTWLHPRKAVIDHFLNHRWSETPSKVQSIGWKDYHECSCRKEAQFPRGGRPRYAVPSVDVGSVHLTFVQLTYFGCDKPINLKYGRCRACEAIYYHAY
jgi:hypothetical protein